MRAAASRLREHSVERRRDIRSTSQYKAVLVVGLFAVIVLVLALGRQRGRR